MAFRLLAIIGLWVWSTVASAQVNDLPNGNFEGWQDTFAYAVPEGYITTSNSWSLGPQGISNVIRSENAYSGNYALEVRTVDSDGLVVPGVAMNASESGGFFSGGFPYNQEPDSLYGRYRYNAVNGDSVSIEVIFKRNGDVKNYSRFAIAGSQNQWTAFALPIPVLPPLPFGNYDTVVFRFRSSSPHIAQPNVGNFLAVDSLRFGNVFYQPQNMDFENWDVFYPGWEPNDWYTINRTFQMLGSSRYASASSDSYFGNFALHIVGEYLPIGSIRLGYVTTNPDYDLGSPGASSAYPISVTPDSVCFYYKYSDVSNTGEQGYVQLDFYQNGASLNGVTMNLPEVASYTRFGQALPSFGGFVPTHMNAVISAIDPNGFSSGVGNELWIDGITFFCGSMELSETEMQEGLWYPNPTSETVFLRESILELHPNRIRILDKMGRVVLQKSIEGNSIDLDLHSGLYTAEFYRDATFIVRGQLLITD